MKNISEQSMKAFQPALDQMERDLVQIQSLDQKNKHIKAMVLKEVSKKLQQAVD